MNESARESRAEIAEVVGGFLRPRSVAVIGASRRRGTIGGELFHNLISYGFEGPVHPVNRAADSVQGIRAYPSVRELPGPVDLAVVAVPAAAVLDVVDECAERGIRRLVIVSAGFAESGPEGEARQAELLRRCRRNGIRVIGPNCMGIANTDPAVRLNATFAPTPPPPGRVGFMSQSGALGLAIMDYAGRLRLGISSFVSVGNKADISGNDLVRYWAGDDGVDVILLYLESFGNPRKFSRIARRVARAKPIVAIKSGRTPAGARAAGSHTGALLAASDTTVDALFREAGVVRTDTLEEMFDVASLLAHQPVPKGRRVAIVTNAGGPGILCADTCGAHGLEVVALSEETRGALRALLPKEASVANPVDMIASASPEQYRRAIEIVGRDRQVDAVVVIYIPPLATGSDEVAAAILAGTRALEGAKPVLTVFMQSRGLPEALSGPDVRVASFAFPENAAIALARVVRYGEWLARPVEEPARFDDVRAAEAAAAVEAGLARGDGWLTSEEVARVLAAYGLPLVEQRTCATPEEVARAAAEMARGGGGMGAGPARSTFALKAHAPGLVHKTEAGAVRLDLPAHEAGEAAAEMRTRLAGMGLGVEGFTLQRMAPSGAEMIVGAVHDPTFGPVLACGAGGTLVELLGDVAIRLAPLGTSEARGMVRALRTHPLLDGFRGAPPLDTEALVEIVLRIGALVEGLPSIREIDLNPVLVHERGATVVDARIRVAPQADHPSSAVGP